MADDKFDWNDCDLVAINRQDPIAIYVNPSHWVVFRFHDEDEQEDRWVTIDPRNVDRVCAALRKAKKEALHAARDKARES